MKNDLIETRDDFEEESEINIYDIIDIFLKNIKLFIIISIIGVVITCLYVVKRIVFDKENTIYINYTLNYDEMNSYIGDSVYYPQKSPEEILLDNKYLELLFENPELKKLYEKEVKKNRVDIENKREFLTLNKILETSSLKEENNNSYRTVIKIKRKDDKENRDVSNSIMATYLDILKQYYKTNIFDYLAERKQYLKKVLPVLKNQLETNVVSDKISILSETVVDNSYFKYLYPVQISNIDIYYNRYRDFKDEYQSLNILSDLNLDLKL